MCSLSLFGHETPEYISFKSFEEHVDIILPHVSDWTEPEIRHFDEAIVHIILPSHMIPLWNNTNILDATYFPGPVKTVKAIRDRRRKETRIEVEMKGTSTPKIHQEHGHLVIRFPYTS